MRGSKVGLLKFTCKIIAYIPRIPSLWETQFSLRPPPPSGNSPRMAPYCKRERIGPVMSAVYM